MDYLDYLSYIRESIHLVNLAKEVPIYEYNKRVVAAFEQFRADMEQEIVDVLTNVEITQDGINMNKEGLLSPSSTWTYLVDDKPLEQGINGIILNPMAMIFNFPFYVLLLIYHTFFRKKGKIN